MVDELVESGIREIILIIHPEKKAIFEHFKTDGFVENELKKKGSIDQYPLLNAFENKVSFLLCYQTEPKGLGHAVGCAKDLIGQDESFIVALPDDLVDSKRACTQQLIDCYNQHKQSAIAVETINPQDSRKYGMIEVKQKLSPNWLSVASMVEKPEPKDSPSNMAIIGRYLLNAKIFQYIEQTPKGKLGEIQLTDALVNLARHEGLNAVLFEGKRLDVGTALGFLDANIHYAMASKHRNEVIEIIKKYN